MQACRYSLGTDVSMLPSAFPENEDTETLSVTTITVKRNLVNLKYSDSSKVGQTIDGYLLTI